MASKKAKQAIAAPPPLTLAKGSIVTTEGTPTFYVNNVEVGCTAYDFSVTCAKIPVKFAAQEMARIKETGQTTLEAVVQMILPPLSFRVSSEH